MNDGNQGAKCSSKRYPASPGDTQAHESSSLAEHTHVRSKKDHALHITNLEGTLKGLDESSRTDIEPGLVGLFHGNSLHKYRCRGR